MCAAKGYVRFASKSGHSEVQSECPLRAISEQNFGWERIHSASRFSVAFHSLGWSRGRRSNVGPNKTVLQFRRKFVALAQSAHANAVDLWSMIDRRRIDWRSAIRTERCCRFVPLSAVLTYIFGSPERSLKEPCRVGTTLRNAEPDKVWQSVQWQMPVISGSASAS